MKFTKTEGRDLYYSPEQVEAVIKHGTKSCTMYVAGKWWSIDGVSAEELLDSWGKKRGKRVSVPAENTL